MLVEQQAQGKVEQSEVLQREKIRAVRALNETTPLEQKLLSQRGVVGQRAIDRRLGQIADIRAKLHRKLKDIHL